MTLAEPHASSNRVAVVLAAATRGERDPDQEILRLVEAHRDDPNVVAERLAADGIRIKTGEGTTLPVISELPDGRSRGWRVTTGSASRCSVRLLQLCTGVQPYRAARAWEGLRQGLGECEITIEALADDRECAG